MQTHPQTLEIQPGFDRDPAGMRLERFLHAQAAYDHAVARREFLAQVAVLSAIPLWLFAAGIHLPSAREIGLLMFPAPFAGLLVSAAAEHRWGRRLREAERQLDIRRRPSPGGRSDG